jgi:hypothetical protein
MKTVAKLLYWKLCFPESVGLLPLSLRVVSGPFRGMPYAIVACASAHSAKLLGTYEKELHAIVSDIQREKFDRIIDIGAAEGYYAVGMARANSNEHPGVQVIAYEGQELGRKLLREVAELNSVKSLDIRGFCDRAALNSDLSAAARTLIICDVEGYETELLDPAAIPALRDCSVLVELHDTPGTPISDIIRQRFSPSHSITEVVSQERSWRDFPVKNVFARLLPRSIALRAMNEARGVQKWFWMRPAH